MPPPLTFNMINDLNHDLIYELSHSTHLGPLAPAKVDEVEPESAALAIGEVLVDVQCEHQVRFPTLGQKSACFK